MLASAITYALRDKMAVTAVSRGGKRMPTTRRSFLSASALIGAGLSGSGLAETLRPVDQEETGCEI